jgi:hypothetical protein
LLAHALKSRVERLHGKVKLTIFTVVQPELAVDAGIFGADFSGSNKALYGLRSQGYCVFEIVQ